MDRDEDQGIDIDAVEEKDGTNQKGKQTENLGGMLSRISYIDDNLESWKNRVNKKMAAKAYPAMPLVLSEMPGKWISQKCIHRRGLRYRRRSLDSDQVKRWTS